MTNMRDIFTDEISRKIFDARIKIGAAVKKPYFPETLEFMVGNESAKEHLITALDELANPRREKFIYGAGVGCRSIIESVTAITCTNIVGIIDNNVTGERYGLPIINFAQFLKTHKNALVFNSVGKPAGETIHRQCVENGVDIISLYELDHSWDQYFDLPARLGLVNDGEVFVQAGCYNGDTQKSYINWFGDKYENLIAFEPNQKQLELCRAHLSRYRDVELVAAGLSDKTAMTRFTLCQDAGLSHINVDGTESIQIVALDDYMRGGKVSFIALDVEGEEIKALRGAEQIIRRQKPKLAVSVYHKPADIYEIPELINDYNPEYRFYLRHYHLLDMAETVLYAF